MSENDWIYLVPSIVFSRIKAGFSDTLLASLNMADKNFSTVSSNNTSAVFPFVFVDMISASEQGRDLDGKSINGGLFTFQVDVTAKTQKDARSVMIEVSREMKEMGFEVISIPDFKSVDGIHRSTARFRRLIGALDIL